jgi:hypothetical protein
VRFFGEYLLIVGVSSMVYGVHNRSQDIEDKIARSEARKNTRKKSVKATSKKTAKKVTKKK